MWKNIIRKKLYLLQMIIIFFFHVRGIADDNYFFLKTGVTYNYLGNSNPNTGNYKGSGIINVDAGYTLYRYTNFNFHGILSYNYLSLNYVVENLKVTMYNVEFLVDYEFREFAIYSIIGYSKIFYTGAVYPELHHHDRTSNTSIIVGMGGEYKINKKYRICLQHKAYKLFDNIGHYSSITQNGIYFKISF